ncbi:DUF4435 domain-containing protein [Flavobacterium jejuense]|uniref:DUF4435 domain-containing protein n=1 Tax=Flavobacterium jejuense TaxID=1544455 RepID=A0ABX0IMV0_9FLAO|nr:DUF4435 domain-containing protein [Flavobacterium jejuense]NHN24556.1 DUF4435 domain-containing protein [Flavobacterium jejuense]
MSNTVDLFFNAKENISDNKSLLEIKQHYDFNKKTLHVFVEADDDFEFYRKSIEYIYSGFEILHYPKNGKKNVLSSYNIFNWNLYDKSRILFFVDKDYEDIIGFSSKKDRNVFVTKFYSIENYISSSKVFKYTLENIFKLKNDNLVNEYVDKFENSFKIFENYLMYLTSIILIFRKNNEHMQLNSLKMDDFFILKSVDIFKLKYRNSEVLKRIKKSSIPAKDKAIYKDSKTLESIKKTGADISKINYKTILKNINLLKEYNDSKHFIRGKYQLWFFSKCVNNISSISSNINSRIQELNKKLPEDKKITNINTSIIINESNIFAILPMKIDKHNDVNIFLIHNKQKING